MQTGTHCADQIGIRWLTWYFNQIPETWFDFRTVPGCIGGGLGLIRDSVVFTGLFIGGLRTGLVQATGDASQLLVFLSVVGAMLSGGLTSYLYHQPASAMQSTQALLTILVRRSVVFLANTSWFLLLLVIQPIGAVLASGAFLSGRFVVLLGIFCVRHVRHVQ